MRIVFAPLLLDEVSAMNKHHLNTHLRLQDFQDSDTLEHWKQVLSISKWMFFMCDFTLQHQTWAQLDMRRSFEPQMKRSPYNNPLLPKTPNIYLNQTLNDPSSLAVCTALWDSKANVLGSQLISQRLICQHDGQTRDSQHLQKLITGLPGRARRCGASQMPRRAARPRSVEGWWIVRSTWRGGEAGTRGRSRHATLGGNWKLEGSNLWVAYYVAKGAGFVLGHHGTGGLTLLFAFLL